MEAFLKYWSLGLIVFGVHLFVLGHLAAQYGLVFKPIGWLTQFAAVCYMVSNAANSLVPAYEPYKETVDVVLSLPMAAGELALAIWLVAKGGRAKLHVVLFS